MSQGRWLRVKDVFGAALERPPAGRAAFLTEACGDDPELRREVESLLTAQAEAGDFLSGPAAGVGATGGPGLGEPATSPAVEGRRIGPYRVLGEIGRGGMGMVFRAVRDDDAFQKTVALKLVRGGHGSAHILPRFRRERQILARLEHPNIASVLDGGATEDGQPYLVMEHVTGESILDYARGHALGTRARLALFRTVCDAVHYAHQNLVVHRDLKPANILVTADGQPKLLDFGIAKLLASDLDPDEAPTATLLPMMTPDYASPEQVKGGAITTASDVYSLGVLLYELLTGQRPYKVRGDSLEEIVRAVCDTEPPPPSAAALRPSELRGDLDTIVMKALRKDPERRYGSALDLSEDIRRHLEGLPVRARPDTVSYRTTKFVGRHKALVAAGALLVLALVGGTVATVRQARIADRRLADVRQLAGSFIFEFHDAIADLPGATAARRLVEQRAAQYLDRLAQDSGSDASLQRELATAYQRLGDAQGAGGEGNLGDTKGALASYDKALAIRRALSVSPGSPGDMTALALVESKVSSALVMTADWERAEQTARSAASRLETAAVRGEDLRAELSAVYRRLGYIQARRGDEAGAFDSIQKAAAAGEAYVHAHPDAREAQAQVARVQSELVERLGRKGEHARAAQVARSSRAILEGLLAKEPTNVRFRRDLVYAINIGAAEIELAGEAREARASLERALAVVEGLVRAEPDNQGDRIALAYTLDRLGVGLIRAGEVEPGLDRLRQAERASVAAVEADSHSAFARERLAEVRATRGLALFDLKRHTAEMCGLLRQSASFWEGLAGSGQLPGEIQADFQTVRSALATCPLPPR